MTFLGLRDGAGLRFTDGSLTTIEFGRFGRVFGLVEEFGATPGALGEPLPYLPLEASLDISDARYRGLDPYSGRQAQQALAAGLRTVSVLQSQSLAASGLPQPLLARAHMDITLGAPLIYRLRVGGDAAWESDEVGAEVFLEPGCTVRVSATVALAIEDNGKALRLDLPAGASTIEIWMEGQPPASFAPAVIVCTPQQIREAAVVASAVGSADHAYIPLLDLSLPPLGSEEFQAANTRLSEMSQQLGEIEQQMQTVAQQGAQAAGGLVLPGAQSTEQSLQQLEQKRDALLRELEPQQQRILTYAAWSRRSAVVTRLIASLTAGSRQSPQLLLLAPYPVDLIAEWAVTAEMTVFLHESVAAQATDWQKALAESSPFEQTEIVQWKDLTGLATEVWTRVRTGSQPSFFTIPDEPAFYAVGLLDALRRGRALLPRGRAGAQVNLDDILDKLNVQTPGSHAIVVEADSSVASLVGALYAHHVGARLYVNPTPDIEQTFGRLSTITQSVEREQLSVLAANAYRYIGEHRKKFMQSATADAQLKQVAAGLSILELPAAVPTPYSDQQFVQALSTYLTAQQAGAQQGYRYDETQWQKDLAGLEAQVSAAISPHVRQAVADASHITVFTSGLPYGLAVGFEGKVVGLVLRDVAAPYILRSLAHASIQRPALTLGLTLDPGLTQRPAPEVAQAVDRLVTLRGPAASLANLSVLASVLPLDMILLHTQGGPDTLYLGDARNRLREVHISEVGSQVSPTSAPLVVYTSPLAWLGLGAMLLEQGAGGFVGALWPVEATASEDAARVLLSATLVKGEHPAQALLSLPGFNARSSKGFVFLGTATWPAPGTDAVASVPSLYATSARLAALGRADTATLIYDKLRALTGEIAAGHPTLRAELLLLDADLQMRLASRSRQRPAQDAVDKAWQSLDVLEKMSLPEQQKKALQVALWERTGALDLMTENFTRAAELLASARDAHQQSGQAAAALSAGYLLAIVQERQHQWAAARQTLLGVQAGLAEVGNAVGLVSVATSLAYVSLPLAMYPDVLGHLKLAVQASLALGIQVLSETLMQTLQVGKAMAQAGAFADVATLARTLADLVQGDTRLPESDRTAIAGVLLLMQETTDVLRANAPGEERETKLAVLVEKAQASDLANSLGMGAWILGAGSPPGAGERDDAAVTG
jgi:hypothetical protein